jgi:amino acid permease
MVKKEGKKLNRKLFFTAIAVLVGTCIGAGVLGIPYVAAQAGFSVALFYIIFIGIIMLVLNLYLGEVSLRTKEDHQLTGYTEKYLGKKARKIMEWAAIFGIYSSIVAYLVGVGDSLSFLVFGNLNYSLMFGIVFGVFMALLIWDGVGSLKKFEVLGVGIVLVLILVIVVLFAGKVQTGNLSYINIENLLLPFGVVLFALGSFFAIPEIAIILKNKKKLMKKVLITGSIVAVSFYILFSLVVTGFKGIETPEVATLALGGIFILLGIFTIFTSHLSIGNALEEDFILDDKFKKNKSWLLSSIIPILIYVFISFFDFFSFTKILSIGGVISGGTIAILVLFMAKSAKKKGKRKPEYSIPLNWFIIILFGLIFILGALREIILAAKNF